jgi:hypothetical protein
MPALDSTMRFQNRISRSVHLMFWPCAVASRWDFHLAPGGLHATEEAVLAVAVVWVGLIRLTPVRVPPSAHSDETSLTDQQRPAKMSARSQHTSLNQAPEESAVVQWRMWSIYVQAIGIRGIRAVVRVVVTNHADPAAAGDQSRHKHW